MPLADHAVNMKLKLINASKPFFVFRRSSCANCSS
uniref:Uncharacterized protein n=1 Tax=Arundo donax TaxID=35708 RepID=A0A0A9FWK5_ARUDO